MILVVVGIYVWSDGGGSVVCGSVRYCFVGSIKVVFFCYRDVRAGPVAPVVSGYGILLDASVWSTLPWFLLAVAWSNIVWVVVINIGMLGLIYCGIIAITFKPGVSGHDISLVA